MVAQTDILSPMTTKQRKQTSPIRTLPATTSELRKLAQTHNTTMQIIVAAATTKFRRTPVAEQAAFIRGVSK